MILLHRREAADDRNVCETRLPTVASRSEQLRLSCFFLQPAVSSHPYHYYKQLRFELTQECLLSNCGSLEIQKPSRRAGRSSDVVGRIPGGSRRCLMRKRDHSTGNRSSTVSSTCQLGIYLSAEYISMCTGTRARSFGRYADFLNAFHSRRTEVIGAGWSVEHGESTSCSRNVARRIIYLCLNSACGIRRWKKTSLVLQADHRGTGPTQV